MIDRRFLTETAALVTAAVLCAAGANLLASRERKLPAVGDYPNARVVPPVPSSPAPGPPPEALPTPAPSGAPPEVPAPEAAPTPPSGDRRAGAAGRPGPAPAPGPGTAREGAPKAAPPTLAPADLLARFPAHPDRPYREISGEDAAWLHGQGALFLDARRTKDFEEGHVAGARPFSVWESDVGDKVFALVNEGRPVDQPVVAYCSGGECEDSHMLSEKLFGAGFTNVLVYKDGWPDWQRRGGPARRGPHP